MLIFGVLMRNQRQVLCIKMLQNDLFTRAIAYSRAIITNRSIERLLQEMQHGSIC